MDASVNRIPSSEDERALLIGIKLDTDTREAVEYSLDELKLLVATAGAVVIDSMIVKRQQIDAAHIIGRGYIEKIKLILHERNIRLVIFDLNTIRPAQIRNLESLFNCRVVGRTEVILDIFARRARSSEAKIQVELAQLHYILPRLKGLGGVLSRLGGGIGTRGPGEKMLETDRRHILRRISKLNDKLESISNHRQLLRKSRSGELLGAVVGYTNAGKSTLINYLAKDDLFVEDRLFATLDAYTRIVYLDAATKVLLTDTVGFISNLPSNLIESFKSTLEEIRNAHFLIHVIDISSHDIDTSIRTVMHELKALECHDKPQVLFFNKADTCLTEVIEAVQNKYPDALVGSARTGDGISDLKNRLADLYRIKTSHPVVKRNEHFSDI